MLNSVQSPLFKLQESVDQRMILKSEVKTEATSVVNSICITKSEGKRPHARDVNKNTKRVKRQPTETSDIILTTYSIIWRYLSDLQKKQFGK